MSQHVPYVERQSPPTSYAIAALLEGEPGAGWRVAQGAAMRGAFLAPGLYVGLRAGGIKPSLRQLILASLIGSASISALLVAHYAARRARMLPVSSR